MAAKIHTVCGKSISKSNFAKHRRICNKCGLNKVQNILESYEKRLQQLENEPKTTVNILNVNIVPFSHEPLLNHDLVKEILEPVDESVPRYVKLKHFVEARGNIRIPNKSQKRIQVFTQENGKNTWVTKDRDEFIKDLTGMSMIELDEKYNAGELSENWKKWAERFNNSDKQTQQKLDNAVMYTILDNQ
ncbi:MAG: hypothetical protein CMB67_04655 [Euryarchaeota archaeon]|nr:hypothetical protein [Euryarchaeota archaeon]|tara:strand:+ start:4282 stop:4848 length:567 start_codon:yes stop_codon:yes gene_type:complete